MHVSHTLPQPLVRLARILAAFERLRVGGDPCALDRLDVLGRCDESGEEVRADCRYDMEIMSLSQRGSPHEQGGEDLDFMSLSIVEGTDPGRRDSLGDLSLTRNFPSRPGI